MAGYGGPRIDIADDWEQTVHQYPPATGTDLPPICAECVRRQGLCRRHRRAVLPQLAQPHWYRLVGEFQYCECGHRERSHTGDGKACTDLSCDCAKWTPKKDGNAVDTISTEALEPEERRRRKAEAKKRFKRSARAAIATAKKRKARRRVELVAAIRKVA